MPRTQKLRKVRNKFQRCRYLVPRIQRPLRSTFAHIAFVLRYFVLCKNSELQLQRDLASPVATEV